MRYLLLAAIVINQLGKVGALSLLTTNHPIRRLRCASSSSAAAAAAASSSSSLHARDHARDHAHQNNLPSWEDIESILNPSLTYPQPQIIDSALDLDSKKTSYSKTKPTLFRERHGWCPYSERVWLALEILNVDYDTIYIDNTGYGRRPSYFSGQTPQMKWEDGSSQGESMDLVRTIHSKYSSGTINLYPDEIRNDVINKIRAFELIFPKRTRPSSRAAFLFRYDGEPLWKNEFEKTLRETNELLSQSSSNNIHNSNKNGGPFFCGKDVTAADIAWAPFLERYAAQLPCLHEGLHPRSDVESYPYLVEWYDAMDELVPAYSCRVKGDASSWRKVLTMAGFGNDGVPVDVSKRMDDVQEVERMPLTQSEKDHQKNVWDMYSSTRPWVASSPSREAASVMTRNRYAIMKDIEKRSSDLDAYSEDEIDEAMRAMICLLCEDEQDFDDSLIDSSKVYAKDVGLLATYLDDRMCVPRDMGSYSAATIKRLISRMQTLTNCD